MSIRVLVVDDSVVIRKLVGDLLSEDPDIEVVGTAINGRVALTKAEQLRPDVITMDIEMPELNGIEAVRALRGSGNTTPIIMFSTLTERGATATFDALAAGATDYVAKPANVGSVTQSFDQVRSALIPRIKGLAPSGTRTSAPTSSRAAGAATPASRPAPVVTTRPAPTSPAPVRLLVIGCSTGGPEALARFLEGLPRLPVPVAVVQHMPPVFTAQFAARLNRALPYEVVEAQQGRPMEPGVVHIAPGDYHLRVVGRGQGLQTALDQAPAENYCRPAVDVLFRSAATATGAGTLGVVLTGMGQDGCLGTGDIVRAGGSVIVQDRQTSVVWGMPGAIAEAGLAEAVLPLAELAPAVRQRVPAAVGVGSRP
ncbi:chemotaxis response regulator protein-glutamate methylesterase [Nocardioides mangrovicus]|uniref:Protein-glutamate methylesterase/protein-glutamine glutaminase n=1 Tax=Nocardioides mangrovicus TaxID=2478913 RepID=A0A3L8P063_9ACTN|nr:chemotaxis response regulator protein-glutamate methylesterase [Nocardioides mangrovicus]RLV48826.1 chemotaxis response regulator protein-glutamate methylesterase [Nocardioides mangrovicus]